MPKRESDSPTTASHQGGDFTTTHWSVVLAAGNASESVAREALESLCHAYWYPLYAYVRRRGYAREDAQDLTQSFFVRLFEKGYVKRANRERGKFRTFLLTALQHFLTDEWDRARRQKRGSGQTAISFDALTAEERYLLEPVDSFDAASLFDRRWATTLLERALHRLEHEDGQGARAENFRELRRFLAGDQTEPSYGETAERLGLSIGALRMAVSRLRRRFREILRQEILQTVSNAEEMDEEHRALMIALRG